MRFDWLAFLQSHNIEYVDSGPNTKKGNVSVQCPFCGSADKSQHMGIDPVTGYWGCWRDSRHRGRSPVMLVAALTRISVSQARRLVFGDELAPAPDDFSALDVRSLWSKPSQAQDNSQGDLSEWAGFRHIRSVWPTSQYHEYLARTRGFGERAVSHLCEDYTLRCDVSGRFQGRIILPIVFEGVVVSWTSRAISETAQLRYKDLEVAKSARPVKHCLYNYDGAAVGGRTLVIVEGPFDALKLDFFGRALRLHAVGIFTRTLSEHQRYLLARLYEDFDRAFVMLDADSSLSEIDSAGLCDSLRAFMPEIRPLAVPKGYKDAGEMRAEDVSLLAQQLSR